MELETDFSSKIFDKVVKYETVDGDTFKNIATSNAPTIIKRIPFGDCMQKWDLTYLNQKLSFLPIVIHESSEEDLDFIGKNFAYKTCTFQQFVGKLEDDNSYVYLRSTNINPRCKKPAKIEDDFPDIAQDLKPVEFIPYKDGDLYHSSVLRIASPKVQIWTHFDLYDNILCQVRGTKRVILFPPEDSKYLYVEGDKSKVNNFDEWGRCLEQFPLIRLAKPYRCLLGPGEALFIPALWWHNIRTLNDNEKTRGNCSISFNIFWKDKELAEKSFYGDNDVYGNKNLKPFDAALSNFRRAVELIDKLPKKYSSFYRLMLLNKAKQELSLES